MSAAGSTNGEHARSTSCFGGCELPPGHLCAPPPAQEEDTSALTERLLPRACALGGTGDARPGPPSRLVWSPEPDGLCCEPVRRAP